MEDPSKDPHFAPDDLLFGPPLIRYILRPPDGHLPILNNARCILVSLRFSSLNIYVDSVYTNFWQAQPWRSSREPRCPKVPSDFVIDGTFTTPAVEVCYDLPDYYESDWYEWLLPQTLEDFNTCFRSTTVQRLVLDGCVYTASHDTWRSIFSTFPNLVHLDVMGTNWYGTTVLAGCLEPAPLSDIPCPSLQHLTLWLEYPWHTMVFPYDERALVALFQTLRERAQRGCRLVGLAINFYSDPPSSPDHYLTYETLSQFLQWPGDVGKFLVEVEPLVENLAVHFNCLGSESPTYY